MKRFGKYRRKYWKDRENMEKNTEMILKKWKKVKSNSKVIWKIQENIVKRYEKYGWNVKWDGKYGRKVSWKVKRYGKYGKKASWIVKWYGKYGRQVGWIVKWYGKLKCFT